MRIVVLAGGVGGARFLIGLRAECTTDVQRPADITVIGNTADDIVFAGLHLSPDLDTVMYTLGGGVHPEQGWGRIAESTTVQAELRAYGEGPDWFTLGDRDIATHLVRTRMLQEGSTLSAATARLCERWNPGITLLPMSDDVVQTLIVIDESTQPVHFQEYWVRRHAEPVAREVIFDGITAAAPAPGVLAAIADADVIVLAPSNPVVSIGTILAVPGIRDAVIAARAPVVGVSPIIGGAPVRGMADKMLAAIGVPASAEAVAQHYGSRAAGTGVLDGWLLDTVDAAAVARVEGAGITARAVPLLMHDLPATEALARAALGLAAEITAGAS
ncbi:MAG: 2-phospho-L-lactate transferase [Sporichthyaceae bacterium]